MVFLPEGVFRDPGSFYPSSYALARLQWEPTACQSKSHTSGRCPAKHGREWHSRSAEVTDWWATCKDCDPSIAATTARKPATPQIATTSFIVNSKAKIAIPESRHRNYNSASVRRCYHTAGERTDCNFSTSRGQSESCLPGGAKEAFLSVRAVVIDVEGPARKRFIPIGSKACAAPFEGTVICLEPIQGLVGSISTSSGSRGTANLGAFWSGLHWAGSPAYLTIFVRSGL